jgi:hypothetical protein
VVLEEKNSILAKELYAARHRIRNHPALLKLQKEQDIRYAMEAEYNAALQKVAALSSLNLECHAWKQRVLGANEDKAAELAKKQQVLLELNLRQNFK